jgi:hypothetical protein
MLGNRTIAAPKLKTEVIAKVSTSSRSLKKLYLTVTDNLLVIKADSDNGSSRYSMGEKGPLVCKDSEHTADNQVSPLEPVSSSNS